MISPTRAMIMAAGLGTRMRPLTGDRPKPLVEVGGKPLIDHAIDRLTAVGVTMIVVNLHYKADMLKAHLAKRTDVEIQLSEETDGLLGTGGGVVKALGLFAGEPFFIYEPESGAVRDGVEGEGMLLMTVDNLPCELPFDSSREFGVALVPFVPAIARVDFSLPLEKLGLPGPIRRALILHQGKLTPEYRYLERFLKT